MPEPNIIQKAKALTAGPADRGLAETQRNINEYKASLGPAASEGPAAPIKPASGKFDKVNQGTYGSRPGEKRIDVSTMTKPLGSYKHGTDYVPKTGMYKLHEGEAVKSKAENMMDHLKDELGGAEKHVPAKKLKEIRTRKAANGGYIHEHHHEHPEHHPMEEHMSPEMEALHAHMEDHLGEPNDGEMEAEAGDHGIEDME